MLLLGEKAKCGGFGLSSQHWEDGKEEDPKSEAGLGAERARLQRPRETLSHHALPQKREQKFNQAICCLDTSP